VTDDAKEWVTIKVPKTVRDDARDDPRTYGEIMRDGVDGEPGRPVTAEMPEVEAQLSEMLAESGDPSAMLTEIQGQLERVESSASTIEERTGRIEQALEDMGARR
jgi:hypothetical protein